MTTMITSNARWLELRNDANQGMKWLSSGNSFKESLFAHLQFVSPSEWTLDWAFLA
jgi:hypothetical protein